jgi:hypothetical protein
VTHGPKESDGTESNERRKFLQKCGEFAAVTPPAIALLLSTSLTSEALAYSAGAERGGGKPGPHPVPSHPPGPKLGPKPGPNHPNGKPDK